MLTWNDYPLPLNLPPLIINDPTLPVVSIVTPSYNQGLFIEDTIQSVLEQDYPNIEYWVIDGGSTDETLSILHKYTSDQRLHWISEPDQGQADAVNKGWRRCRGDIVGWLNSDDTFLPGALRRLTQILIENPKVDIVCADALRVTANGQPIERMYGGLLNFERLLSQNYINQPATIQRRQVIEQTGPLRLHWRYALDYDFYLRALLDFDLAYLPEICATYRMHETSKSVTGKSAFFEELSEAVNDFFAHPQVPVTVLHFRKRIQSDWLLSNAITALKEHNDRSAMRHLVRALSICPLRPQIVFVLLMIFDRLFRTSIYSKAHNIRQNFRNRHYTINREL